MSKWSGSAYDGPKKLSWEEGFGKHKFPNGVVYEGNFKKGEFHDEGTLIYPNGVRNYSFFLQFLFLGSLCSQVGPWKAH